METFILDLLKLILINIVLSGDNAVVIALACRNLPQELQKKAVFWGSFGAIGLRIVLTFLAVWLLEIPFVQIAGGLMLLFIAYKLLAGDEDGDNLKSGSSMREAVKTIIIADLIMSLDNVVAVAGAANGNFLIILIGLAISIPLIIWGSQLLMTLMNRFPIIALLGAGLLGYTAGEMILGDDAIATKIEASFPVAHYVLPIVLAVLVMVVGKMAGNRAEKGQVAAETAATKEEE
ncbi:TerC family protein [Tumebacillus sp. ITR2]|uniref:TerC family protein n=1 Tax=Tumebacillus amylolyticus TaxID=2801339 RepID=A0ABS1J853_9BACL|nr:TerC family protein [Tumebacillus amylolyticus]MBL0386453.1 TerC family protein [Tumebacillus amylolyticus]